MKKIVNILAALIVVFTFFNCSNDTTDVSEETTVIQSKNGEEFIRLNEIISRGEELIYEAPSGYVEENSHYFEEEFASIETIDVVRYNDFHFFKITGQNYEALDTIEYYAMDDLTDAGAELSSGGGNGGSYCNGCTGSNRTRIDYFVIRPDGSYYLERSECPSCPPALQHAISAANINSSSD